MKSWSAYPIRFLLVALCEKPEILSAQEKASAGSVARRLFEFATTQTPRDKALVRSGIETVCRTYDSDPAASKSLLSSILTQENLQAFGYEDMPTLAREAQRLLGIAPEVVRDLYAAAFGFEESSTDQTAMGPGRILPLTSNRRQDYHHGLWQLGETFPIFLKAAPALAVEALMAAILGNVANERLGQTPEQQFQFNGVEARIRSDGSWIWDALAQYRHEAHLRMLDAFEAELNRVANEPSLTHAEQQILSAVIEKNNLASVWRKVLMCGTRNSAGFGKRIAALACSLPILTGRDTSNLAGNFITAIYPEIAVEERERIENAILSIPNAAGANHRDAALTIRDRLLGCIPIQLASVGDAKNIIAQLNTQGGPPPNHPPLQVGPSFGGIYTDTHFLADRGVPVQVQPNRTILELTEPLKAFVTAHSKTPPTLAEIECVIAQARALHVALGNAPGEGAHEMQVQNGWCHLVAFCKCAAWCETLHCNTEAGGFIRELLLEGARHPSPVFNQQSATEFDTFPSWSPSPRVDAAEGLMFLALKPASIDLTVVQEIARLSKDPVPSVRLHIADHLGALAKTSPKTMKELLSEMAEHDPSSSVVLSVLKQFARLSSEHSDLVERLMTVIFARTDLRGDNAEEVRLTCVSLFLDLFLWRDNPVSEALIRGFAIDVLQFTQETTRIVARLRETLVAGPVALPDPICEKARRRAFNVLEVIVSSAQRGFLILQQSHRNELFSDWPKEAQQKATALVQLVDSVSSQLYFASGALEQISSDSQTRAQAVSIEQKRRFLNEAGPLLDLLANDPHPSTVHHLIEMLQSLVESSPREVFLRITRIVQAGKRGGYQQESLAIGLIVNVVNMVLADFRPLLQDDQEMRAGMVSILDVFVEAGWPQAIQLTYRLDEIFR